jgi:ubiquinone/menaquinone biosynthesis C-methylase UbiE
LYPEEAEQAIKQLKRVLKPNGTLLLHTGPNKILYDYVYPLWIYPVNRLLTTIDQLIKGTTYQAFHKQPRTKAELEQHVNEPTYFYLKDLLKQYGFEGALAMEVGFLKEGTGIRTRIYNFITTFYPLSKLFPFSIAFSWIFVGYLKNLK